MTYADLDLTSLWARQERDRETQRAVLRETRRRFLTDAEFRLRATMAGQVAFDPGTGPWKANELRKAQQDAQAGAAVALVMAEMELVNGELVPPARWSV